MALAMSDYKCRNCFYFASVDGDDECDCIGIKNDANDNPCDKFELHSTTDVVIYHIEHEVTE